MGTSLLATCPRKAQLCVRRSENLHCVVSMATGPFRRKPGKLPFCRERGRGKERKKEKERGREAKVEAYLEAGTQAMVRSEFHLSQVLAWRAEPSIQRWLLLLEGQPILWLPWSFTQAIYAS